MHKIGRQTPIYVNAKPSLKGTDGKTCWSNWDFAMLRHFFQWRQMKTLVLTVSVIWDARDINISYDLHLHSWHTGLAKRSRWCFLTMNKGTDKNKDQYLQDFASEKYSHRFIKAFKPLTEGVCYNQKDYRHYLVFYRKIKLLILTSNNTDAEYPLPLYCQGKYIQTSTHLTFLTSHPLNLLT